MARILCLCGETLSNSESPNDIEIYCFPDRQFFELTESGQTDFENIADVDPEITIWKCPSCGRLLLFMGESNRPVVYKIEKDFTHEE